MCILLLLLSAKPSAWASVSSQTTPSRTDCGQTESVAKDRFLAALAAYQAQQYAAAESVLKPLVKSAPDSFDVNELLGLVYVAEDKHQEANAFLAKAVQLKPEAAEARTRLATNLLALGQADRAEVHFKKVAEMERGSYDANHNLGEFYIQVGKISNAIPFLKRAQEIDPSAYNNGYDLALALQQTGQFDQAREQLHKLIALRDSAELHSLLGDVEEKVRNYLSSAEQYEQAARMDPSEQNILNWGAELILHQTFAAAIEVFKAGIVRFPQSPQLHNGLGIALYGAGQVDDAVRSYFQASDLAPSDPLPLTFLGKACDGASPDLAAEIRSRLQSFLNNHTKSSITMMRAELNYDLALCLWRGNEIDSHPELANQIESLLKRSLTLDPNYADAYFQLGNLYSERHSYEEAIAQYERALKVNANSANFHYRLGQALARAGKIARAQEEFTNFDRLRKTETDATNKQQAQIQQFVYTIRKSDSEQQ
ncbi:MAG TPA: tetratricopeptide repeat protein [Terriglobales bacterium]|nr:tetratricopeptide repeat protein [Terriglobales bacterium]